jgi:hypothetical protein
MENQIQTSLPNGSPIVAFGTQGSVGRGFAPWMWGVIGAVVVFVIFFIIVLSLRVPFPKDVRLRAYLGKDAKISDRYPTLWRLANGSHVIPRIIGFYSEDNKTYAIVPRWQSMPGFTRTNFLAFSLITDEAVELQSESILRQIPILFKVSKHEAFLELTLPDVTLAGPFDGHTWKTDLAVNQAPSGELPEGDIAVDFQVFPQAWPQIQQTLAQQGWMIHDQPQRIGWSQTEGLPEFSLIYANNVPTTTALSLMSAGGLHDTTKLALPDGEVVSEFTEPTSQIRQEADWELASGTHLLIKQGTISIQRPGTINKTAPFVCPGVPVARFRLTHEAQLPFDYFSASLEENHLVLCVE